LGFCERIDQSRCWRTDVAPGAQELAGCSDVELIYNGAGKPIAKHRFAHHAGWSLLHESEPA
jgi:hypothetical protein